jgi:hypothetical protein
MATSADWRHVGWGHGHGGTVEPAQRRGLECGMTRPAMTRRAARRAVLALATVALISPMLATPAGAANESRSFAIAGTIEVGPPPALTFPAGTSATFDYDPVTGAITNGVTTVPPFERGGTGPQATFVLSDATPFTGSLDPVTGEGELAFSFTVEVQISDQIICELAGPVSLTVRTSGAGGAPLVDGSAIVTAVGFAIPAVVSGATCESVVADAANALFGTPTSATSASFTVTETTPAPAPAPEPAPEPAPARPTFTG